MICANFGAFNTKPTIFFTNLLHYRLPFTPSSTGPDLAGWRRGPSVIVGH